MLPTRQPREATEGDLEKIKSFLRENGLPDLGVDKYLRNFVIVEDRNGSWVGVAGLELYGESGLMRSVAVEKHARGKGHGRALVNAILRNARAKGLKKVFLLTDDASDYFERLGFETVDRMDVDDAVKTSLEFTEACPDSATAMRKMIG